MAWVRIHDGALTHPKVVGLSHKAFRLWVWGLSYSQQHLTDGRLPMVAIPTLLKGAARDLVQEGLWEAGDGGVLVHDYLEWNDSREVVLAKRDSAKTRLQSFRVKRVSSLDVQRVSSATSETLLARSGVGKSSCSSEGVQGEPSRQTADERAGRLREELYPAWYAKWRNGARLRLVANSLDFQDALSLVHTWDDARLEKLAKIILTTNDEFIAGTDRGFHIFAIKASWADDRLRQAETNA